MLLKVEYKPEDGSPMFDDDTSTHYWPGEYELKFGDAHRLTEEDGWEFVRDGDGTTPVEGSSFDEV